MKTMHMYKSARPVAVFRVIFHRFLIMYLSGIVRAIDLALWGKIIEN